MKKFTLVLLTLLVSTAALATYDPPRALNSGTDSVSVGNFPATQPVSASSLPLPTGAATSAKQDTGNTSLGSIDTKLSSPLGVTGTFWQATQPVSLLTAPTTPVTGTFWQATQPVSGPLTDTQLRATPVPVSGTFWQATQPVSGSFFQATQPVSASALPLPTGAATSGNQTTANSSLSSIDTKLSGTLTVNGSGVTQPVSAAALPLPSGASTSSNQTTANSSLSSIDGKLPALISSRVPVDGSGVTQPISASALPLPSGAATESTLSTMSAKLPSLGQTTMSASQPVAIASDQSTLNVMLPDSFVTGQSAQTATVNNIIPAASSANANDLSGYKSAAVQVVSTGTGGTFIFEGSNDNSNFQAIPVYSQVVLTGLPIVAAVTATSSQLIYTFPIQSRYIRLRIATTITGGSIQAFSRFSQASWNPGVLSVAQATAANLATTATIASGTVTTVSTVTSMTSGNLAIPGTIADVASAALTTTTTTATLTPTFGTSYQVNIPVTVVSGTTPTLDFEIQESRDAGTNWYAVYDFPRITATGIYYSPVIPLTGNRVRYVQTVAGTTPSFTRSVNRLQISTSVSPIRQLVDRSISDTTLNSTTPSLNAEQGTKNVQLVVNIGATTIAPQFQIQGSDDAGATWYSVGSPLTAVASSTVQLTVNNVTSQLYRVNVSTAGTVTTAGYVLLRAF